VIVNRRNRESAPVYDQSVTAFSYPAAERLDTVDELHGHRVPDPYRWLEDPADPRTAEWSRQQDELAAGYLSGLPGRDGLRERLTALLATGSVGAPMWRGGRAFFTRRAAGGEHPTLLVREPDGVERTLIDPLVLDPAGTTTLDAWTPSIEGDRLAYQLSSGGNEESALFVLDIATGEQVEGPIDRCRYSPVAWLPGGEEYFYVRRLPPEMLPPRERQFHRRVYHHRLGTDPEADDTEIFGAGLEITNYYDVSVSRDGRWLVVDASAGTAPRTDVWIADLAAGERTKPVLREIQVGVDATLHAWVRDGVLYLFTDRDAPRGRLAVADPAAPQYPAWRDVVPEQQDGTLTDVAILAGGSVLAAHSYDATHRLALFGPDGARQADVAGLGVGSVAGLRSRPEGGREAWVGYTDFVTPPMVLAWSADEPGVVRTWATAPGSVDASGIEVSQARYPSRDGTPIHAFLIRRADAAATSGANSGAGAPAGPVPTVLYGYGGFNVPLTPAYGASILAWAERGGLWVVANLRGGSEHGEDWHRAGMRERKQNVFDDFAAVAEGLVGAGLTTPDRLGIFGGSNGGLLVGAALTQRPDLYRAVVCSAPLLDMVRYEQFGLGRTWNDEYGTADNPAELKWLLGYSPYHHVRAGVRYPAVLFTTFDSDTRVDPMHARKMCAALQHATAGAGAGPAAGAGAGPVAGAAAGPAAGAAAGPVSGAAAGAAVGDRPVLLRRETEVGHGQRSVSRTVGLATDQLAFFAARLGLPV
jgi:prolyl oligopeptidase